MSDNTLQRYREALEYIAESIDAGRHDGLPEPCPAHDDVMMWLKAKEALANQCRDCIHARYGKAAIAADPDDEWCEHPSIIPRHSKGLFTYIMRGSKGRCGGSGKLFEAKTDD